MKETLGETPKNKTMKGEKEMMNCEKETIISFTEERDELADVGTEEQAGIPAVAAPRQGNVASAPVRRQPRSTLSGSAGMGSKSREEGRSETGHERRASRTAAKRKGESQRSPEKGQGGPVATAGRDATEHKGERGDIRIWLQQRACSDRRAGRYRA